MGKRAGELETALSRKFRGSQKEARRMTLKLVVQLANSFYREKKAQSFARAGCKQEITPKNKKRTSDSLCIKKEALVLESR